jgi:hypothetical protein
MVRALSMIKNAACCQGACPAAPLFELDFAIKNKDEAKFAEYYGHLTDACNACHQAALQTLVVVIQDPKESMFPDQDFRPKQ